MTAGALLVVPGVGDPFSRTLINFTCCPVITSKDIEQAKLQCLMLGLRSQFPLCQVIASDQNVSL